jgi:hypothetical protein
MRGDGDGDGERARKKRTKHRTGWVGGRRGGVLGIEFRVRGEG